MHERRRHTKTNHQNGSMNGTHNVVQAPSTASKLPRRLTRRKRVGVSQWLAKLNHMRKKPVELGIWPSRALLFVVAGMYSTNYASVKFLETTCDQPPCNHDPAEIAFSRFFVSAMVCLPILYMNRKQMPLIKAGLECGISVSMNYICQAEALEYIPAAKCCFIGTLTVATVPFLNAIFIGKPIKIMSLVSAAIALVGVAILENLIPTGLGGAAEVAELATNGNTPLLFGLGKGDILAMGQPIGFGYSVMRIDYYLEKYQHLPNRVLTITAAQCVAVCVLTFSWVLYDNGGRMPDLSYMIEARHMMALGWTGIVTSVGAIVIQGTALQRASATDAALIFCTEPILASLFAGWLLNETPPASTYVGGAVIIIACVLGSLSDSGGHGGGSTGPSKARRRLRTKDSNIVEESILPTRIDPGTSDNRNGSTMRMDTSVPNLTDVPSTRGKANPLL